MTAPSVDRDTLHTWQHHLQDEADAAYLYDVLATAEPDNRAGSVYRQLAEIEQRHVAIWRQVLAEHGVELAAPPASFRARILAWVARRFGPKVLTSFLLREEGQEVKSYLSLYRTSVSEPAKDTALTLAKESAEHAETLRQMTGAEGEPWHSIASGGFLRNVVYGFNDGLTANFGLVAGVIGASVEPHIILVTGMAGTIADALSMGASGYLASKSEQEVYAHEIAMERDEIKIMPELEREELALLYEAKGIDAGRARAMAADVMQDPDRALEEKVREELRIGEAHTTPLREGLITGVATAIGALIPVAPFFFFDGLTAITVSFAASMLSHFGVGAARSLFTGRSLLRSGMDMFVVGAGVAVVGYFVGEIAASMLGR
jgi:vacuolar iron transporter family protein